MSTFTLSLILVVLGVTTAYAGGTPPDPFSRDEDISGTRVSVDITRTSDGLYAYNYAVVSPTSNLGDVLSIDVDLSCAKVQDRTELPPQEDNPGYRGDSSPDGLHAAVNLFADPGNSGLYGIDVRNQAGWMLALRPGEQVSGLRIFSTLPPKSRRYVLLPSMGVGAPWDYSDVDPTDPNLPWIDDFTVYGMIEAPGCPGDEPPPVARFPGTPKPEETEAVNDLLSYSEPLRDRLHVAPGMGELAVTIHYADDIDPKTFRVQPQANKLRRLFNPKKGRSETVFVPLNANKNKVILSVQREFTPPGRDKTAGTPAQGQGKQGLEKDIDVFEVRVDSEIQVRGKKNGQ